MLANNSIVISSINQAAKNPAPAFKTAIKSSVVLLKFLPSLKEIQRISVIESHKSRRTRVLQDAIDAALDTPLDSIPPPEVVEKVETKALERETRKRRISIFDWKNSQSVYEPFQVLRAIERKDLMELLDIRTKQFSLLVQPIGGVTPLVHAMRLGSSHREVAIILTGAMSKMVNEISDVDLAKQSPETLSLLRAIQINLKIAISYGIQSSQTDLLASYLQVIVMAQGTKFIRSATQEVSLALRGGSAGKPVETACEILSKWVDKELKSQDISSVNDYLSNAAGDLILMGLWNNIEVGLPADPIPTYYFARDDRVIVAFNDRIKLVRQEAKMNRLSNFSQRQIKQTLDIMTNRNLGPKAKVAKLRSVLDHN